MYRIGFLSSIHTHSSGFESLARVRQTFLKTDRKTAPSTLLATTPIPRHTRMAGTLIPNPVYRPVCAGH
jgi:hypothetical protein